MTVKTRFAPSPTGFLHIGGARTALYAYLFAKHHKGKFVLRIEDTDKERSTQEAIDAILEGMEWLGLHCDEGPFFQSKRTERYLEVIQQLLDSGHAYRCYCSKERLDKMREQQIANKEKARYDRHCHDLNRNDLDAPHVIRFRNPDEGEVVFEDQIRGEVSFSNSELDDLIIARTDGSPTYNFTVVVDDSDMGITHVIRGDDHINNTPRQINMLNALGSALPKYAHLPMIMGDDGKKLSKRHGAVSVMHYRDDGYLPEAVLNYLVRLGWSHGDQEIFSMDEMIELFNLKSVSKSSAIFNTEKLQWLNQHYIKTLAATYVAKELAHQFKLNNLDVSTGPSFEELISAQAERCKTLKEMVEKSRFFYAEFDQYDETAANKNFNSEAKTVLEYVRSTLSEMSDWDKEKIHQAIVEAAEKNDMKMGKVAQPIRVAVTGNTVSPSIDLTLVLLGKEKVLARLQRAIEFIG